MRDLCWKRNSSKDLCSLYVGGEKSMSRWTVASIVARMLRCILRCIMWLVFGQSRKLLTQTLSDSLFIIVALSYLRWVVFGKFKFTGEVMV